MTIKFNKHHVTNGTIKARVFYSLDNRGDSKPCVTLFAKDYSNALEKLFPESYENDTEIQSDYIEEGRVALLENHPLYRQARQSVEKHKQVN